MTRTIHGRAGRASLGASHQMLRRAAHLHADQGLFVFPLAPGRKVPAVQKDWEHQATTDHMEIARTWRRAPYNIGIATGPSGLLVVDLDLPRNTADLPPEPWGSRGAVTGVDVLTLIAADAGHQLPATYTVTTPSGGQHLYFHEPEGRELGNSAGRIGWKIDTRGHGGYVVGTGSIIGTGRYSATCTLPPQELPDWITTRLHRIREQVTPSAASLDLKDSSAYALAADPPRTQMPRAKIGVDVPTAGDALGAKGFSTVPITHSGPVTRARRTGASLMSARRTAAVISAGCQE
jgi:hypothetical protein